MEGAPPGNARNKTIGHGGDIVGLTRSHRELGRHALLRRQLVLARVGHVDRSRADAGVKALHQSLLAGHFQALQILLKRLRQRDHRQAGGNRRAVLAVRVGGRDSGLRCLGNTVGIEEGTADIHHPVTPPVHGQAGIRLDHCHRRGFQVFLRGSGNEFFHVLGIQHHGHTLLGLGDCQFGAVQTIVFLGHAVQVDVQAVGQLTDGHAHAARAEIVATLNQAGHIPVAEQALDLPLGGRIALLHLGAAGVDGFGGVGLGGAGGAAAAVPSGASAQQDNDIPRCGHSPHHVRLGRRADDGADLQPLSRIAGIVQFRHLAGGQPDLVAIGGISRRRAGGNFPGRQLAGDGLFKRQAGISATGDPHGLIDIGAPGQRITDGAAQTGGRATEGLDFGGMIVRLVFELHQPLLSAAVNRHRYLDGTGVDLVRFVQIRHLALLFQQLGAQNRHVHQADILLGLPLAVDLSAGLQIGGKCLLDGPGQGGLFHLDIGQAGQEGGVAAMIRPIGVDDAQLRHGGIALLLIAEIIAAEGQIRRRHGEAHLLPVAVQRFLIHSGEAGNPCHICRPLRRHIQCFRLAQGGDARFHRVHQIALDPMELLIGKAPLQTHDPGGQHLGPLPLSEQLDTLGGGIRPLVVLAGQVFHSKHLPAVPQRELLIVYLIRVGLGKHGPPRLPALILRQALNIVAVEQAKRLQFPDTQVILQISQHVAGLDIKAFPLFHIYPDYT